MLRRSLDDNEGRRGTGQPYRAVLATTRKDERFVVRRYQQFVRLLYRQPQTPTRKKEQGVVARVVPLPLLPVPRA